MPIYEPGDVMRFHATFVASGGAFVSPASVYFVTRAPGGALATYGWPANITNSGVGGFYIDLLAASPGDFAFRWRGAPSAGAAGAEGVFSIHSQF